MAEKRTFALGSITERAKWAHLARLGSQSELRSDFILPVRGFSHIVKYYIP